MANMLKARLIIDMAHELAPNIPEKYQDILIVAFKEVADELLKVGKDEGNGRITFVEES